MHSLFGQGTIWKEKNRLNFLTSELIKFLLVQSINQPILSKFSSRRAQSGISKANDFAALNLKFMQSLGDVNGAE